MSYDHIKTTQAAAYVLRYHQGCISRLRLLKILVIADRQALSETLQSITSDRLVAMDHGPVLSQTYDMLKGKSNYSSCWNKYIQQEGPQNLRLIDDPGIGRLSRYEIDVLEKVCDTYRYSNDYDLAEHTHTFPEWIKNKPPARRSNPIPMNDLLEALNISAYADKIERDIKAEKELDQLFGVLPR